MKSVIDFIRFVIILPFLLLLIISTLVMHIVFKEFSILFWKSAVGTISNAWFE
jgi:hypothetical protein